MEPGFTTEHEELRRTVRGALDTHSPEHEVRRLMVTEHGHDPRTWSRLASMGLPGLAIPEKYGGAGYGWTEVGVVLEEAGRALLCGPYFSTVVLGAGALLAAGDEAACAQYLPAIASGERIATLAHTGDDGRWDTDVSELNARRQDGGWVLDGQKSYVLDGCLADLILVTARTDAGLRLFAAEGAAAGLRRTPLLTMDLTRKQARLEFSGTPARLVDVEDGGDAVVSRVLDLAAVGLAAEQVGGAARVLEMAVGYAKMRHQFGRPIGSFQAVKHMCADMLVEIELARSAAYHAMWAADEDLEELPIAAGIAKAHCADAYFAVASQNIQVHGGTGFTWEHPAHLYLKRAKTGQLLFGDSAYHRKRLARAVGL